MFKKQQGKKFNLLQEFSLSTSRANPGGFARCYQIYENLNNVRQHYAFKIIKKSTLYETKELIDRLRTQIKLHKKFSEPQETSSQHIVRFIESFQTQDYIYLLLQLCVNQTLNELIRRRKFLSEEETRFYIWQLAHGLKQMHSRNVVHRDIKLCNLFLSNGLRMKIGDFGLATQIKENRKRYTLCGTANYIAPEMIQKDGNGGTIGHGYQVDVWALGVVCYTIYFGKYPFEAQGEQSIYNKVLSCKYSFNPYSMREIKELNINSLKHFPSDQLRSFLKGIFEIDPSKRLTLNEVLAHEFLNKTTVPQELPETSLKWPLKKEIADKMFSKKQLCQNSEDPQVQSAKTVQSEAIYLEKSSKKIENQNISEEIDCLNSVPDEKICELPNYESKNKTESYQVQEETVSKINRLPFSKIIKEIHHNDANFGKKFQSVFIKCQKKRHEEKFNNPMRISAQSVLLEIVLSKNLMETSEIKQLTQNGMAIKVFNMAANQFEIDYTIIMHPKLNYLAKQIELPRNKNNSRKPLGQVPESSNKKEEFTCQENGLKEKWILKIPLKKNLSQIGIKSEKDQNNTGEKYLEELNIVKVAYRYLNKLLEKGTIKNFQEESSTWVCVN